VIGAAFVRSARRFAGAVSVLLAPLAAASPAGAAAPRRGYAAVLDSVDARLVRADYAAAESLGFASLAPARGVSPSARDSADAAERVMFATRKTHHETLPASRALADRALAIRQAERPPDSLRIATAMEGVAYVRAAANDPTAAHELGLRVLAIRTSRLPPDHPDVSRALHNLGSFSYQRGRYVESLDWFRRAVDARVRATGEANAEVAYSLNGEASCAYVLDKKELSDSLQRRILAIRERILPEGHPDRVKSLSAVALTSLALGNLAEAERWARRAVAAAEAWLPEDHVERAFAYQRLADVLRELGDYAGSRTYHERTIAIFTRTSGPDALETLGAKRELQMTLLREGDYREAERVAREQYDGYRRQHGTPYQVGDALDDLAFAQFRLGLSDSAIANERRAYAIIRDGLGPSNSMTLSLLTNLASMEAGAQHWAVADSLFGQALEAKTARFGPASMQLTNALQGQGAVREARGDYAGANDSYQRALRITRGNRPPNDPLMAIAVQSVARIEYLTGRRDSALVHGLEAERIGREHLEAMAGALAEREALRYAGTRVSGLPIALSLAADAPGLTPAERRQVWDALVRSRSLVLDALIERRSLARAGDAETARLAAAVAEARSRRARLALSAADSADFAALDSLRHEVDRAERALAERSAPFRHTQLESGAGLDDIARAIPTGTALLAYVRFEHGVKPGAAILEHAGSPPAYAAFVLPAGGGEPVFVSLGSAAALEPAIARWAHDLATPPSTDASRARAAESACRNDGRVVGRAIWDPVARVLGSATRVLVVPDGALNGVPLAALPDPKGGYLVERPLELHMLTRERDVLVAPAAGGIGLLALGGVDFESADSASDGAAIALAAAESPTYRGTRSRCDSFARLRFGPLPGTQEEVESISHLLEANRSDPAGADAILTGPGASEAAFKRLAPGRRIVHLATHAFFVDASCAQTVTGDARGVLGLVPTAGAIASAAPAPGENPLLLSGLALAGANQRASAGERGEDGVLTSDEIAALDLSGLDWAVLSACGTGLGEQAGAEGVLGLRRAFLAAGAHTVFTSLWSVRDQPTREWMTALYRHRFSEGMSAAASARSASLDLLKARRAAHTSTHPFEWAAFVAAGDWR